jgi:acyl carrier protein
MEDEIQRILAEVRPEVDFTASTNFVSDGLIDSYDMIEFITELERIFGVMIDGVEIVPENFANLTTIRLLVERSKQAQ